MSVRLQLQIYFGLGVIHFCRSRSKDKKHKKNSGAEERRRSLESGCSEHNYETPKLLQKSPKTSPPQVFEPLYRVLPLKLVFYINRRTERRNLIRERKQEASRTTATSQSARPHSTWKPGLRRKIMSSTQSWSPMPTPGTSTERLRRKAR